MASSLIDNNGADKEPPIDPDELEKLKKAKEEFSKRRKIVLDSIPDGVDLEELKKTILEGLKALEVTIDKQTVSIVFKNAEEADKGVTTLKSLSADFEDSGISITFPQPDSLLFVGNLPFEFTDEEFEKLMSQYGKLERIFLVRSELTGGSKGYGFAEYPDKKTAGEAKQQLLNSGAKYIAGRILRVDFAEPNLNSYKDLHSKTLFLDRLPRDFTDGEVLRELFSKSGTVTFAQVAIHHQSDTSRGFAFVDFSTSEEAEKAQRAHNGALIGKCNIRTSYGTPGRLGATVLGVSTPSNTAQKPKPGSLMSAICPNTMIRPSPVGQPMSSARPLMATPLMGAPDPRAQMGMPLGCDPRAPFGMQRFPDPRGPRPMMRPGIPLEMGDPRAAFLRPTGPRSVMPGISTVRPPAPFCPSVPLGPRPLMASGSIREPCAVPMGPRGVPPRGIPGPFRPAAAAPGIAAVRPLMDGNCIRGLQQPQEIKNVTRPLNLQMRPHMNHNPNFSNAASLLPQQTPQPLMQSGLTQPQQQQNVIPLYQQNPHLGQQQGLQPLLSEPTQQSSGVYPGLNQYQQSTRPARPVSGLPGQNQQVPENVARLGSTTPAPLMSVITDNTDQQQGQARPSLLNNNQTYPSVVGQSVPGQSITPFQSAGIQSKASYNQDPCQTSTLQATGMDQSYVAQQSVYQQQQQGMAGYIGQSVQSPLYQQSGQMQQQWQQQATPYAAQQKQLNCNTPTPVSSSLNSASLQTTFQYNNSQGSQASLQNPNQKQPNQHSTNQIEPLLKRGIGNYSEPFYGDNKRPRF